MERKHHVEGASGRQTRIRAQLYIIGYSQIKSRANRANGQQGRPLRLRNIYAVSSVLHVRLRENGTTLLKQVKPSEIRYTETNGLRQAPQHPLLHTNSSYAGIKLAAVS